MSYRIHTLPDDEAVLRKPSIPVPTDNPLSGASFDVVYFRGFLDLARPMAEIMLGLNGVGLAAQQVGILYRVCLIDPDHSGNWAMLLNPQIVDRSQEVESAAEGCLSIPGRQGQVERSVWVEVLSLDGNADPFVERYEGWVARVVQHELDHLDGTLICDKWDPPGL
ncbi:MAG TPA: peptide deformylase [Phycisphaerae bacterium]|nr:peptide deformylase [Phycisphaerae bacterium]